MMQPLPKVDEDAEAKDFVHVLEFAIVSWIKQIKTIFFQDPEQELNGGNHQSANLQNPEDQIHGRNGLKSMAMLTSIDCS